jgi:hypothetical protein
MTPPGGGFAVTTCGDTKDKQIPWADQLRCPKSMENLFWWRVPDEPMEVLLYPDSAALANGGATERFRGGVAAGSLLTG